MIRHSDSPQIDYLAEVYQFSTTEQVLSFFDRFKKNLVFKNWYKSKMFHTSIYSLLTIRVYCKTFCNIYVYNWEIISDQAKVAVFSGHLQN